MRVRPVEGTLAASKRRSKKRESRLPWSYAPRMSLEIAASARVISYSITRKLACFYTFTMLIPPYGSQQSPCEGTVNS